MFQQMLFSMKLDFVNRSLELANFWKNGCVAPCHPDTRRCDSRFSTLRKSISRNVIEIPNRQ